MDYFANPDMKILEVYPYDKNGNGGFIRDGTSNMSDWFTEIYRLMGLSPSSGTCLEGQGPWMNLASVIQLIYSWLNVGYPIDLGCKN